MADQSQKSWIGSASLGLAVLSFINLFNYLDRYVLSALVETLKHSELALTDANLGALMSAFLVVFTLTAPLFGTLGDTRPRPRLIAFGVALWSIATALSGFAGSYLALLAARASVGVGEAAYITIAPSLLSDYFPAKQRGRVMAIFFCAIPVGSALGYVVGGLVGGHFGWRMAFFVAGVPGLALAALCLLLRDPPRGSQDAVGSPAPVNASPPAKTPAGARATYRHLLHNVPYVYTVLGYAAYTFAMGGLAYWMPAFLERVRGIPHQQATVSFGAIVVVTGFIGTFAGGWLGDYGAKYVRQAYLWLSGAATLAAAPFAWLALTTKSSTVYLICMVAAQLLMFASTGPINAAIVNLVRPTERASAVALSVFCIHLLGDAVSPYLIGAISDVSSLGEAVKIVPVAIVISGLIWCWAARAPHEDWNRPSGVAAA
jgi:predicted MFS family arabinose efflux permease